MIKEAVELQQRLNEFACSVTETRERLLPDLVAFVKGNASPEILDELTIPHHRFREALGQAIRVTLLRSFEIGIERVLPWVGGYTVVLVDQEGTIRGASSNPSDKVYEKHRSNLYPYALSKAIFNQHLDLAGRRMGLGSRENFRYIKGLVFKTGVDLFMGEYTVFRGAGSSNLYIGASGCELTEDYAQSLLPQDMKPSVDFVAGYADTVFAKLIANNLMFPTDVPTSIPEPALFSKLRIAH